MGRKRNSFCYISLLGILVLLIYYYLLRTSYSQFNNLDNQIVDSKQLQYNEEEFAETIIGFKGSKVCNGVTNKPNIYRETFQFQNVTDRNVVVFSAYHETRLDAGGSAIRIIAAGLQREFRPEGDLYCTLWYHSTNESVSVGPAEYHNVYRSIAHPDMWCTHFILCPLPTDVQEAPYAVSVTHKPCSPPSNVLYVTPSALHKKGKHAVCYPVLHNKFNNWTTLVEFFELQRLLGAEEITIYNFSVSPKVTEVLKYFQNLGWLKVIPWPLPKILSNYFQQRTAINDCIYRHMYRYDYVSVLDLDEVFVPRMSGNWRGLVETIGKPDHGVYLFQHYYFRRNDSHQQQPGTPDNTDAKYSLISLSSFYRTYIVVPPGKVRCKSMYKTDSVIKADIHFPYQLIPGAKEYLVDPREAALHHYRSTPMESFTKHPEKYKFLEDRRVEIYSKELLDRYKEHLENLV